MNVIAVPESNTLSEDDPSSRKGGAPTFSAP
jgi:hypothetical protein